MTQAQTKIPISHRNEWKSKRRLEDAIDPWYLPFEWTIRDYGIDGQVEITKQVGDSSDVTPQGQYFLIQLKCTEDLTHSGKNISYPVPVKKILQWYSSNLPVLLTLFDLKQSQFHSLWINDQLISYLDGSNPKWISRESVTIKITPEQNVSFDNLPAIGEYVTSWKQPYRKIIQSGLFFELKKKCVRMNECFSEIAKPYQFNSIDEKISILERQLHEAIYRVAITGPSRTGKSSLINAMLGKKDLSPTGIFQTTGVPIQILPGTKEEVQVLFEDGKIEKHASTGKVIRKFASQDENANNLKKVSIVTVYTRNSNLEKGISLFDIPGLDDPIESIYEHAWMILRKSNAIFYLIDASVAATGGFVFKSEYKKEIQELSQRLDKIFLVFNKVNALTPKRLGELKNKVDEDLKRLNLYDKVSEKIYYISAEESLAIRLKKSKKTDSLGQLENDLWQYLLKENKIGLRRLSIALEALMTGLRDFSGLLNTRLLDLSTKRKLILALTAAEKKVPDLSRLFHQECKRSTQAIKTHLENQKSRILENLERQLTGIPQQNDLPGKQAIKSYLAQSVMSTLESANQLYAQNARGLNNAVRLWIEGNFQQIWEIVSQNQDQRNIEMKEFETIEIPEIDVSNSIGVGTITWAVTSLLAPGYALAIGVASFFSNLLLTAEERRAKRIAKLMTQVKSKLGNIYIRIESGYLEAFQEWTEQTRNQINSSMKLYLSDLHRQVNRIDIPVTPDEEIKYSNGLDQVEKLKAEVIELSKELVSWHTSL